MSDLSDAEREILLDPCACGHTLNDHGDLGGCWMCNDEGESETECWVTCEALMVERVGKIVTQRTAAAEARAALLAEVVARVEALADELAAWSEEHFALGERCSPGDYDTGVAYGFLRAEIHVRAALASPASVPETSATGSQSAEEPITGQMVAALLRQAESDKRTAYWGEGRHKDSLDGAVVWLESLRDHLSAEDAARPGEGPS